MRPLSSPAGNRLRPSVQAGRAPLRKIAVVRFVPKKGLGAAMQGMKSILFLDSPRKNAGLLVPVPCCAVSDIAQFAKSNTELTKYPIFMGWLRFTDRSVIIPLRKLFCGGSVALLARYIRLEKCDPAFGYFAAMLQRWFCLPAEKTQKGSSW